MTYIKLRYKYQEIEQNINKDWLGSKVNKINNSTLNKNWSIECKRMVPIETIIYKTSRLQKPFKILIALICRLYVIKDATVFQ